MEINSPRELPGYVPLTRNNSLPPITQQPESSKEEPSEVTYTKGDNGNREHKVTVSPTHSHLVRNERLKPLPNFCERSVAIHCPECKNKGMSMTKKRPGLAVFGNMCILCLIGMFCIFFLPICFRRTYDTVHYCPECDSKLGRYRKKVCMTEEELKELDDDSY